LIVETTVLLVAHIALASGRLTQPGKLGLRLLFVGGALLVLCGGGIGAYCFSQCVQSEDGTQEQFYHCWQREMWFNTHIIWFCLLTVPLSIWGLVLRQVRRAKKALKFNADSSIHSKCDIMRAHQLLKLQEVVITEIYRPLRWYPVLFLLFALVQLIYTIVELHTRATYNAIIIMYLMPAKGVLVALVYFQNTPHTYTNLRRAVGCCCGEPARPSRRVRIGDSVQVRLIDNEDALSESGPGRSIDYTEFEDEGGGGPVGAVWSGSAGDVVYIASLETEYIS